MQQNFMISQVSGGRCAGSGGTLPKSPSTRIATSHLPPPPRDISSAPYPGHWHLVGLYIEVGCPHLIQGSIVQLLQGEMLEWVIWMRAGATRGCGGSQTTMCDKAEVERDLISLCNFLEGNYGGAIIVGNGCRVSLAGSGWASTKSLEETFPPRWS